ncbi:glycosyltransferase family 2 protein [Marinomonas aquiplantarum]|uniref:Glycosyltransferase involved in cell wall biosynthesis n=1 Tax=Marinomonas aquiplantarum TaxID=491951 RepID=A0A366D108_9GAMM|nr:glycosyltransferase family 2 protein [Marinomonas aquiplantarum]RBO83189.1 glycosyltransferase involved in cell wall biosynthesis [Marinomonas aquiplantarum]
MISGNIITLNEENNISDCIKSLQTVCDEIIVVDSGSHDNTINIAKTLGAKIVHQAYLGDGIQKNVALKHTKNTWVLSLDADERLTQDAIDSIKKINFDKSPYEAFSFRRKNMIGSRWIKHCGWYPDRCVRLYNSKKTRFADVKQHAKVQTNKINHINADIIHYSFRNIGELFAKPGRNFSGRAAKIMYAKGKRANALSPFAHGLNAFIRKYIFQRGFLGGVDGFTVSLSSAVNSYLKYAKLLEYQRDSSVIKQNDFNNIW